VAQNYKYFAIIQTALQKDSGYFNCVLTS